MSNQTLGNSSPDDSQRNKKSEMDAENKNTPEYLQQTQKVSFVTDQETSGTAETQQVQIASEAASEQPAKKKESKKKKTKNGKPRRWPWVLLGLLIVIILSAAGGGLGYYAAINMRLSAEDEQVTTKAVTQFLLAQEDQNAGRLEMARQRYQYIIQLDPSFPGAAENLTQVMLYMAETAVPTEIPTPTAIPVTPTPDFRGIEEKYATVEALLRNRDWNGAIEAIEILREEDLLYRAVDVDGIYYIALRYRGVEKILGGNLEAGIYDLKLAEGFGPLDKEADSYRNWARYYITGSSFWEIDWYQVVEIFGEIYPSLPNLRDGSGWTAQERYRIACVRLGDQLATEENWCDARYYYRQALSLGNDTSFSANATLVAYKCEPPTPTPTITPLVTSTPEPTATSETTVNLDELCCPPADPDNPDASCADYTCPAN